MKINCKYCNCSMDATTALCPHCGGVNEKAAFYSNHMEKKAEQRRQAQTPHVGFSREDAKKAKMIIAIGAIVFFALCLLLIIVAASTNEKRAQAERLEKKRVEAERLAEEERIKAEEEQEKKAYDEAVVAVTGINTVAEKDRYYSIQVTDVVSYELNYDHNVKEWGAGLVSKPHLFDSEHRVAIQIKVKNYGDKVSLYKNPTAYMGLYICDENENNCVISEDSFLNGSSDDNYYSGGMMISDTKDFIDNYSTKLEKNQTMSWWVPVVVNEASEKLILHFNYNISITVDNPYYNQ